MGRKVEDTDGKTEQQQQQKTRQASKIHCGKLEF